MTRATEAGQRGGYRAMLALTAVALFFSGIALYAFESKVLLVPPVAYVAGIGVLALPTALTGAGPRMLIRSRLLLWCFAYAGLTIASFLWSSQSDIAQQELRTRLLATAFLVALIPLVQGPAELRRIQQLVIPIVIVAVTLNIYEFFVPLSFGTAYGRSAGLYLNPNVSAGAILVGALIGAQGIPNRWREPWLLLALGGVILTLSRGTMLAAIVGLTVLGRRRVVRPTRLALYAGGFCVIGAAAVVVSGRWVQLVAAYERANEQGDQWTRVLRPQTTIESGDESSAIRAEVARAAVDLFLEHPILGAGVGATSEWQYHASTHNIYLRHLAEYGLLGAPLMILLVGALAHRIPEKSKDDVYPVVAVILALGLFSHNVLDDWPTLIAISYLGWSSMVAGPKRGIPPSGAFYAYGGV